MREKRSKILSLVLALVMLFSVVVPRTQNVSATENTIKVIVDFEGYNLGQGFYIEPAVLEIPVGSTAAYATDMLLNQTNNVYEGGSVSSGFFLDRIQGFDTGEVELPGYLAEVIEEYWDELDPGSGNGSLGSNDYVYGMSGWMFTVNHAMPPVGASDHILQDGDVIRWQFSLWGFGTDLGLSSGWSGLGLYAHEDKTTLFRALSEDNVDMVAKQSALDVIINPLATLQDVSNAIATLGSGGTIATPPELTALTINSVAVADFNSAVNVYTIDIKGKATSTVVAAFDSNNYTLSYNSIIYESGQTISISTPNNSGVTIANLVLTDINDANNQTTYKLQLVNPRAITLSSAFKSLPANSSAKINVLIEGKAECTLFQASALGVATTSTTYSATVYNYSMYLLTETDAVDIMLGNVSTAGYIRVLKDGEEIIAPKAALSSMVLQNLPVNADVAKLTLELCTTTTYTANNNEFVAEASYNLFVRNPELPATELEKLEITDMQISTGAFAVPFTPEAHKDTIMVLGNEGVSITYSFSVADSSTTVYKNLTSSTLANTLTPTGGVYSLAATITEPFAPQILLGVQTPLATERVINGYTVRYQYKILYDTVTPIGGGSGNSPFTVIDYLVTASQYTNKPLYGMNGDLLERGILKSLGNFGGYVTVYFEDGVQNNPKNANGVDLNIAGNCGGPTMTEPGNVWVSVDNIKWYLLAGSDYFDDNTLRDYEVTYTRGFNGASSYVDNYGSRFPINPAPTSTSSMYNYPLKSNYPLHDWKAGEEISMTLRGPLLLGVGLDPYGSASAADPLWGYVDAQCSSGFDISWAIDEETGAPVYLSEIYYVKIATASHIYAGAIGEKSTEVQSITRATPTANNVGKTTAPSAIKINGTPVSLTNGVYEYMAEFGNGSLTIAVEGTGGSNVYINNANNATTRTYTTIPSSGTVRIVLQETGKEQIIYYINNLQTDKTALNQAISDALSLSAADYRAGSWAVMQTALSAAQAVSADVSATQIKINNAAKTLNDAISSLLPPLFAPVTYSQQMNSSLAYILSSVPSPTYGTTNGEWSVFALARAGYIVPNGYYEGYIENVIGELQAAEAGGLTAGQLDEKKATDNERLIITLASLGIDPEDFEEYNLLNVLANYDWTVWQGLNSITFALIAIDANNFEIPNVTELAPPVSATTVIQTTRQKLIDELLNLEIGKGTQNAAGWAQSSVITADVDGTAQALAALAPYYRRVGYDDVTDAADRALEFLSSQQNINGGFGSWETVNVESNAQVVVALTALGIDPQEDERFVKANGNPVSAILSFYVAGGGFKHIVSQVIPNGMATDQATYALVAYDRLINERNSLYDMSDAYSLSDNVGVAEITVRFNLQQSVTAVQTTGTTFTAEIPYNTGVINNGIIVTASDGKATVSAVTKVTGINQWTFTVTAQDGTAVNYTLTVSVSTDPSSANAAVLEFIKSELGKLLPSSIEMTMANTSATVEEYVEWAYVYGMISDMGYASDVKTEYYMNEFNPAVAGSAVNRAGTQGSYVLTIELSLGEDTSLATDYVEVEGVITATRFISSDVNNDGQTDAGDLAILLDEYGKIGSNITVEEADVDGDGQVDSGDLSYLLEKYGK